MSAAIAFNAWLVSVGHNNVLLCTTLYYVVQ